MYPFTLPSGIPCEIRELTGAEEELLTNPKLLKNGDAINQVLRNCLLSLGEKTDVSMTDVLDLLAGDRLFLLVKLRQVSLGDEMTVTLICPNPQCQATNQVTIHLDDLPVTPYTEQREFTCTLAGSGQTVRFVHLDGHMEKRLAALPEATLSQAMLIRIRDIDGTPPTKKTLTDMALKDRQAVRQAMLEADAGIDTVVEMVCNGCGTPMRTRVEGTPHFLFPHGR